MEPQKEPHPSYLPYPPQSESNVDEIDVLELFQALWKSKWIIVATTLVFAIASVLYALSLPNIYKADTILAPVETSNSNSLSKMAGQLGGLAALAGVNLGGADSSQTDLAVQVMKSRNFIDFFISKHDLLVPIMAAKRWDLETNKLILDDELYDAHSGEWLRDPIGLRGAKPTAQEAFKVFREDIFDVSQDKDTGLYQVSIKYYSPFIAAQWVTWLVEDINKVMRERSIAETSQNLNYLNTQLEKTAVADMKSTFYKLIEEQTKSLMLAEVQEEFVFKVVDPAVAPELKYEPKRAIICIVGTLLGSIFSGIFILLRFVFGNREL